VSSDDADPGVDPRTRALERLKQDVRHLEQILGAES
jgi:hypothetical protein